MTKIIFLEGSFKELKLEMHMRYVVMNEALSNLKEEVKASPSYELKREIRRLKRRMKNYDTSKYLPVMLEGRVVDGKFLEDILKRLGDAEITMKVYVDGVRLAYKKQEFKDVLRGSIFLYDISESYQNLKNIPTIKLEGLADD